MSNLFVLPEQVPLTIAGKVMAGAKASFFRTGTSTPKNTYSDAALTTPHANPVVADAGGAMPAIFLDTSEEEYRVTVTNSADVLLYTQDNVGNRQTAAEFQDLFEDVGQSAIGEILFPRTAAEIAASAVPALYSIPSHEVDGIIRLSRYTTDRTGSTDLTAVMNTLAALSASISNAPIELLPVMRLDGNVIFTGGTMIFGPGSQGSTQGYGCSVDHRSTGNCFTWNGNGADALGTGGGARNMLIIKANGFAGGIALYSVATSTDKRPGEQVFDNILIYGTGTGMWTKVIEIDGRNANTAGNRGVRTTHFNKVRVASCSTNNQYIHLRQVTHVHGNVQVDTGTGTGTNGITFDDFWDFIHLDLRVGNVVVNHSGTPGVDNQSLYLCGFCDSLDVNYASCFGNAEITALTSITNASKAMRISSQRSDAFFASNSGTDANQTGAGTIVTVVCDTESYDKNSSYDATTGLFTAKCAGLYMFEAGVTFTALGAANTSGSLYINHRDSGGSVLNDMEQVNNVGAVRTAANTHSMNAKAQFELAEGDTVRMRVQVNAGAGDTVGVGGAATLLTYFMGKLLA